MFLIPLLPRGKRILKYEQSIIFSYNRHSNLNDFFSRVYPRHIKWYHKGITLTNKVALGSNHRLRYLTRWVLEKDRCLLHYATRPHARSGRSSSTMCNVAWEAPDVTLQNQSILYKIHTTQTFTAWWLHSSGVTRVGIRRCLMNIFFSVSHQCCSRFVSAFFVCSLFIKCTIIYYVLEAE